MEEVNSISAKPATTMARSDEAQGARAGQVVLGAKGVEEGPTSRFKMGSRNASQVYTFEEVKVLFLILMDLCRRTSALAHPLPVSQVGSSSIQNMPRPRGADAAGLLLRELELHPPSEEWHRRNMFGGPWSDPEDMHRIDDSPRLSNSIDLLHISSPENSNVHYGAQTLWPRKRRLSERDVVTVVWKTGLEGVWYKDESYIMLRDLKGSKLSGSVFNILFNLNKFMAFESRDPFLIRQERENPTLTE